MVASVAEYFDTLSDRFVAEMAIGVNAVFQYEIAGDAGGTWHAIVAEKDLTVHEDAHDDPSAVLKMKDSDFVDMVTGKLSGQMAFMRGKLKVSGSIPMAMKMQKIFPVG